MANRLSALLTGNAPRKREELGLTERTQSLPHFRPIGSEFAATIVGLALDVRKSICLERIILARSLALPIAETAKRWHEVRHNDIR